MGKDLRKFSARPIKGAWLAGLIAGQEWAWKQLVDELHPKLVRYARRKGCSIEEAEEAVQESWTSAIQAIRGRPRDVLYRAYFYTCLVKRLGKRRGRQPTVSLNQPCGEEGTLLDMIGVPCKFVDAVDEQDLWEKAWASLTETERYVLYRIYYDGATHRMVAAELKLTVDQVRYIKHKAIKKLRDFIVNRLGEEIPVR
jgi:RNA polymerase sigma factor (sigma-70 family)